MTGLALLSSKNSIVHDDVWKAIKAAAIIINSENVAITNKYKGMARLKIIRASIIGSKITDRIKIPTKLIKKLIKNSKMAISKLTNQLSKNNFQPDSKDLTKDCFSRTTPAMEYFIISDIEMAKGKKTIKNKV